MGEAVRRTRKTKSIAPAMMPDAVPLVILELGCMVGSIIDAMIQAASCNQPILKPIK